jgi:phosphate transport system permease protein
VSLGGILTGTRWQPAIGEFGIWPLATSTLITSTIALIVSSPWV